MPANLSVGINDEIIQHYVSKMYDSSAVILTSWEVTPFNYKSPNFTTGGVFRIHGQAQHKEKTIKWSFVLKVLSPDPNRNVPEHYNYWKREALFYQSSLHHSITPIIHVPRCYGVEEQPDGTVWLWLEDMSGDNDSVWPIERFYDIAYELGRFNGTYLVGKSVLPDDPWLCQGWINSWVTECRKYIEENWSDFLEGDYTTIIGATIERHRSFLAHIDGLVQALNRLPRVLAHQDVWQKNLFINDHSNGHGMITAIDWQFTSISGVGEELGRFFGLCMSKASIPQEMYESSKFKIFDSYIEGLRSEGWEGDISLPLLGYYGAAAIRSVWEVPKLIKKINSLTGLSDERRSTTEAQINNLLLITKIQLDMADEAINIMCMLK